MSDFIISLNNRGNIPDNVEIAKYAKPSALETIYCLYKIGGKNNILVGWSLEPSLCMEYVRQNYPTSDKFVVKVLEVKDGEFTVINEDIEFMEYNDKIYLSFDLYMLNNERDNLNARLTSIRNDLKNISETFDLEDIECIDDTVKLLGKITKLYKKNKYEKFDEITGLDEIF